jgi:copper resistance protein C
VAALLLALILAPALAAAHAIVIDSTPAAGAKVAGPDIDIRVLFNSRIDHQRSKLTLISATDQPFPVVLHEDDPPDTLTGRAQGLPSGSYRLRWLVLAIDGHITRGDIPFTVTAP